MMISIWKIKKDIGEQARMRDILVHHAKVTVGICIPLILSVSLFFLVFYDFSVAMGVLLAGILGVIINVSDVVTSKFLSKNYDNATFVLLMSYVVKMCILVIVLIALRYIEIAQMEVFFFTFIIIFVISTIFEMIIAYKNPVRLECDTWDV
ncbi:MAG: hypothetical protein J6M18_07015 [Actinomycetaceae bacterium]|nr:hypothetical protein [Actinomycetaceae bacterium]